VSDTYITFLIYYFFIGQINIFSFEADLNAGFMVRRNFNYA